MAILIQILVILVLIAFGLYYVYGKEGLEKAKEWFTGTVSEAQKTTANVGKSVITTKSSLIEKITQARFGKKTKSKCGENITTWERNFLWESINKRRRVRCINCEREDMYEGPQGGMSTNWRCTNCGQGINLTFIKNSKDGFLCENIGIDESWIGR
jgi:hypothetical protein